MSDELIPEIKDCLLQTEKANVAAVVGCVVVGGVADADRFVYQEETSSLEKETQVQQ